MSSFDPRIVALTGLGDVVARLAQAYGALYRKASGGDGYRIDHTVRRILLDPDDEYVVF